MPTDARSLMAEQQLAQAKLRNDSLRMRREMMLQQLQLQGQAQQAQAQQQLKQLQLQGKAQDAAEQFKLKQAEGQLRAQQEQQAAQQGQQEAQAQQAQQPVLPMPQRINPQEPDPSTDFMRGVGGEMLPPAQAGAGAAAPEVAGGAPAPGTFTPTGPPQQQTYTSPDVIRRMVIEKGTQQTPYGSIPETRRRMEVEENVLTAAQAAQLNMNQQEMAARLAAEKSERKARVYVQMTDSYADSGLASRIAEAVGENDYRQVYELTKGKPTLGAQVQQQNILESRAQIETAKANRAAAYARIAASQASADLKRAQIQMLQQRDEDPNVLLTDRLGVTRPQEPMTTINKDGTVTQAPPPRATPQSIQTNIAALTDSKGQLKPYTEALVDGIATDMANTKGALFMVRPSKKEGGWFRSGWGGTETGNVTDTVPLPEAVRLIKLVLQKGADSPREDVVAAKRRLSTVIDWDKTIAKGVPYFSYDLPGANYNKTASMILEQYYVLSEGGKRELPVGGADTLPPDEATMRDEFTRTAPPSGDSRGATGSWDAPPETPDRVSPQSLSDLVTGEQRRKQSLYDALGGK